MSPETVAALKIFDQLRPLIFCKGEFCEFRAFTESGGVGGTAQIRFLGYADALPYDLIEQWNAQRLGIHFSPLPRRSSCGSGTSGAGRDADVLHSRVLFADFDKMGDDPRQARLAAIDSIIESGLPIPTLIIWSGNGIHVYWVLNTAIDTKVFRDFQSKISRLLGTDDGVKVPSRIMRLFGSLNPKPKTPDHRRLVQVLEFDLARIFAPGQFRRTKKQQVESDGTLTRAKLSPRTVAYINNGQHTPEGMRNPEFYAAGCDLAGNGYSFALALEHLRGPARGSGLKDDEIETTLKRIFKEEREPSLKDIPIYDNDAGLPVIWTGRNKPIHVQSDPALKALAEAGDIYVMGTKLVRIRDDGRGGKVAEEMTRDSMRGVLDRLIYWAIAVRTKNED